MPVYFIALIDCPDERGGYVDYVEKVKPIVESHGGTYIIRTENITPIFSDWKPDRMIVIRFATRESLDKCFSSSEYKEIMSLRTENVASRALIVEGIE